MKTLQQDAGEDVQPDEDEYPLEAPNVPFAVLLLTTAHRLAVEMLEELRFEYYSVVGLIALQHLRATGPTCPRHLAAALGSSRSAASQLVGRLVRDGLLESQPDPTNGREKVLRLTPKGEDYGRWATEAGERCMQSFMASFGDAERETLRSLLTRLERNADCHRGVRWFASAGGTRQRPGGPRLALHVR